MPDAAMLLLGIVLGWAVTLAVLEVLHRWR